MIETPQIVDVPMQLTATVRLTIPMSEIQTVMGPGIREIYATLAEQGITATGPWFTHHFQRPSYLFDFEICVPVAQAIEAAGRVRPGELPAHKAARTVYAGPFEGLADAWGEFHTWIKNKGHTPAVDLWERYLLGPESSSNPADWRTELNRPLISEAA